MTQSADFVTMEEHPPGWEGLRLGLRKTSFAILIGMRNPRIIEWTRQTIYRAGLPRGASPMAQMNALFTRQKEEMTFVQDPICTELLMAADSLLCLEGAPYCIQAGDCDDQIIVLGSAGMSAGIPVRLVVRHYPQLGRGDNHAMLQFDADLMKRGDWRCFDPSVDSGACAGGYEWEIIVEVSDMAQELPGQIMTMGRPVPHAMGQTPAPAPAEITGDQATAWLGLLARGRDDLEAAKVRLVTATGQLDAVRFDLGLPAVDPTPAPEAAGGASSTPLQAYATTRQWTAEAQNAQSKLIQTADLVSGMLADGLSGARALYFHEGDLFVSAKAGDPYGVLMVKDAHGHEFPSFVDISNDQPTERLGIAPIIIGIAIVAVSLAAAYAVTKVMDYMAQSHRDDAMQHIATEQQALVTAGHQTPEQAAGFMRAAADLASAPPPGAAATGFPWWQVLTGIAVGVAVGAVGTVAVERFASGLTFSRA